MITRRSDKRDMRGREIAPNWRRHHALDAFQTSGSSPPIKAVADSIIRPSAATRAAWGSSWSR
jgi:hypothetical protein